MLTTLRTLRHSQTFNLFLKKYVYKTIDQQHDSQTLKVNIGGGKTILRHWKTLDQYEKFESGYRYPRALIDYPFDLSSHTRFPFQDNTVAFYYSSHTFEHLAERHIPFVLSEVYRTLKPKGVIRITLPDFDLAYRAYENKQVSFFNKYPGETLEAQFLNFFATDMQCKISPHQLQEMFRSKSKTDFANSITASIPEESQIKEPGNHISWWNREKLSHALRLAGFRTIYASKEQESPFPELRGPGLDATHPEISLFIEAVKSST